MAVNMDQAPPEFVHIHGYLQNSSKTPDGWTFSHNASDPNDGQANVRISMRVPPSVMESVYGSMMADADYAASAPHPPEPTPVPADRPMRDMSSVLGEAQDDAPSIT